MTGQITAGDCKDPDGNVGDAYRLVAMSQITTEFTLTASGFEGALALWAGDIMTGGGPQILCETRGFTCGGSLNVVLPAGTYTVFVTSDDDNRGSYTLTNRPVPPDGCVRYWTTPGVTVNGNVTLDDCTDARAPNSRIESYDMTLTKGQAVRIHMFFPGGFVGVHPLNINQAVPAGGTDIAFTAPETGRYTIELIAEPFRFPQQRVSFGMTIQ
jgi:hypothetical protein